MPSRYGPANPSPRYRGLVALYREMHATGDRHRNIPPERTFAGTSLIRQAARIRDIVRHHRARTLLDYGSGKGRQYAPALIETDDGRTYESIPAYWAVEDVTCFDPGHPPFSARPNGPFDGVICTDVLEHCPEEDLSWIMDDLFGFTRRFVFANVACYPAKKRLPNGENAHCTVRPPAWWRDLILRAAARHPGVAYRFFFETIVAGSDGRLRLVEEELAGGTAPETVSPDAAQTDAA